jgi:hypothetical protein
MANRVNDKCARLSSPRSDEWTTSLKKEHGKFLFQFHLDSEELIVDCQAIDERNGRINFLMVYAKK